MVVTNADGKDIYNPRRPIRVKLIAPHPTNRQRVLISAEGKIHIMSLNLK